ncbi:anaerobic glycerol-3-phosphate dehydrogenase subunit GlpA [Moorella naiadis]|uniref:anaerobic glycerol-3-phosphate dehydrogenase subunit GlpA n=1 Tax=Moorella naiadis (nom. illeg.) TaxID=3093670 RepID=UPI003D9C964D
MSGETSIVIIGGGITGAGILWDLTLRGLKCTLIEKGDFCNGASGRNHGLLHSGGRYAVEDPESAAECASENNILRKIAPWAIDPCDGLFVKLKKDNGEYSGRWLDGCREAGIRVAKEPWASIFKCCPYLNPDVEEAYRVQDAAVDVYKLVQGLVLAARNLGAEIKYRTEVVGFIIKGDVVSGVQIRDVPTGIETIIKSSLVINAAGAWAGIIARQAGCRLDITPDRGVLLVFNARLASSVINRLREPGDGDILVPSYNVAIFGTTSGLTSNPDGQRVERQEVERLLKAGEELIPGLADFRQLRAYTGVRPLLGAPATKDPRALSRTFKVIDHAREDGVGGFISSIGGKFTTYRLMAEKTADVAASILGYNQSSITATTTVPLPEESRKTWALKGQRRSPGPPTVLAKDENGQGSYQKGTREQSLQGGEGGQRIICECEDITAGEVLAVADDLPTFSLNDLRHRSRFGMGTCQGTFCSYRVLGLLNETGRIKTGAGPSLLVDFLYERWKGILPVCSGEQLKETEFTHALYTYTLGLDFTSNYSKGKE